MESKTALYTLIFVPFFIFLFFFQTLLYSLPKSVFALTSLFSTALSILEFGVMTHPQVSELVDGIQLSFGDFDMGRVTLYPGCGLVKDSHPF